MKIIPDSLLMFVISFSFLMFTDIGYATNYYIDQNNPVSNDQNDGSIDRPWKTLNKANQTLIAGDTVFIRAGTYTSYIAPVNSGTDTARIIYKNFENDKVTITNTWYAINLDGKSYIVVDGINFFNLYYFMYIRNNSNYNIIINCKFDQARLTDGKTYSWAGSRIYSGSKYNQVRNCQFSNYGYYYDDDNGAVLDIGNENVKDDSTSQNLVENCHFFHGGHHILGVYGTYNAIRNNYFHNEPWAMGTDESDRGAIFYGNRNLSVAGFIENSGRNLFEGNQIAYSSDPPDNIGASGMALNTSYNIVRFNRFYHNNLGGLGMTVTSSYRQNILYNKVYHNTFFHNGTNTERPDDHANSGTFFACYSGPLEVKNNAIVNNLYYKHREVCDRYGAFGSYRVNLSDQYFAGNWDGDIQGDPKFVSASIMPGNPMDRNNPDLRLLSNSPCRDKGTYLTIITSESGNDTIFTVEDAGYFMDGWGIKGVMGDEIQLFNSNQKARIVKINYQTNRIIVNKPLSWTTNQGLCIPYEGNAPDPGAFECQNYPVGVKEMSQAFKMTLYPNPTSGLFTIRFNEDGNTDLKIEIYNITGSLLDSRIIPKPGPSLDIDISDYPQGIYLMKISSSNFPVFYGKIIKN